MRVFLIFDHADEETESRVLAEVEYAKNQCVAKVMANPVARHMISQRRMQSTSLSGKLELRNDDRSIPICIVMTIVPAPDGYDASHDDVQLNVVLGDSHPDIEDYRWHKAIVPPMPSVRQTVEHFLRLAKLDEFRSNRIPLDAFAKFVKDQLVALYLTCRESPFQSGEVITVVARRSEILQHGDDGAKIRLMVHSRPFSRRSWLAYMGCEPDGHFMVYFHVTCRNSAIFACKFILPVACPPNFIESNDVLPSRILFAPERHLVWLFPTRTCFGCAKKSSFMCNGCRKATYCSAECQKRDWKNHAVMCRSFRCNF